MNDFSCFKTYDIRGEIDKNIDRYICAKIAIAFSSTLNAKKVVIGHDVRETSPIYSKAIINALLDMGVNILDLGLCGTEEVYFATSYYEACGGIMITASHNPINFNGIKLVKNNAEPLDVNTEFHEIKKLCIEGYAPEKTVQGSYQDISIKSREHYVEKVISLVDLSNLKPIRVLVDFGNGAAGPTFDKIEEKFIEKDIPIEFFKVNHNPNEKFPNGVPNPLLPENQAKTGLEVVAQKANIGIAFDGDFDRCFFFDETGAFVSGELIVSMIAQYMLKKHSGSTIICDPRLVFGITETIKRHNGTQVFSRTGHVFFKKAMRREEAPYGGEISAHHYFRDFFYCDSGMIPWLIVLEIVSNSKLNMSEMCSKDKNNFPSSEEINFLVARPQACIEKLRKFYSDASKIDYTDGLSVSYDSWRFNIRMSNTENVLRLNVETKARYSLLNEKINEISTIVKSI
ncbi:phosphomannomutase [Paracoccaceae bacterium]|nr:phosphomannomutase [Paracoccaceae bacterium]